MKFSERLHEKEKPIWEQKHAHPFVRGLGDGTLNREAFEFYMKQDYVYLIDYTKMFALGAAKARDLDTANWFSKLLHETLHFEMDLHRKYAERLGISNEELEATVLNGRGEVYSYTKIHAAPKDYADIAPYYIILVDLDEGLRITGRYTDQSVEIDQKVQIDTVNNNAYIFKPVEE